MLSYWNYDQVSQFVVLVTAQATIIIKLFRNSSTNKSEFESQNNMIDELARQVKVLTRKFDAHLKEHHE